MAIDYARALAMGLQAQPDPLQMALGGISQGVQMGMQAAQRRDQMLNDQRRAAVMEAKQRAEMAKAQQFQSDLDAFIQGDNSPKSARNLLLRYPEKAEQMAKAISSFNEQELGEKKKSYIALDTAFRMGKPELALSVIDDALEKAEISGDRETLGQLGAIRDAVENQDKATLDKIKAEVALTNTVLHGPEAYQKILGGIYGSQTAEASARDARMTEIANRDKAVSQANIKDVESRYAERKTVQDMQTQRQRTAIQAQTARAAMRAADAEMLKAGVELEDRRVMAEDRAFTTSEKRAEALEGRIAGATSAVGIIGSTNALLGNYVGIEGTSGWSGLFFDAPESQATVAQSLVDQLDAELELEGRKRMKGQGTITDGEAKAAGNAMSRLRNRKLPAEDRVKEANRIRNIFINGYNRQRRKLGLRPLSREEMYKLGPDSGVEGIQRIENALEVSRAVPRSARQSQPARRGASADDDEFSDENFR